MIVADTCFSTMINAPVRHIRARVELLEGSTLLATYKHTDNLKSLSVERVGDGKFFGYGICQRLNVKLIDKDRLINITTENTLDVSYGSGKDFIYPHPYFKVSEVRRDENTNELSITAYDYLYQASQLTTAEIDLSEYSIRAYAAAIAIRLGLNCVFRGFEDEAALNLYYANGANIEGTETLREALNAIAEATQSIYYVDRDLTLVFKRLDKDGAAVLTIGKEKYFTLDSKTNRRLAAISHTTELGDNLIAETGQTGTTQYLRDNPFLELREDLPLLLENAINLMGGLTINQFNCYWRGNYLLEIGDKISLITKDYKTVDSYLLNDTINYDGTYSHNTEWEYTENAAESEQNPITLGDAIKHTYAKVDKVNKTIDLVVSDIQTNSENIAALRIDTESITADIKAVKNDVSTNTNEITNIKSTVNTHTENITSITADTTSIKASVSSLQSTVETNTDAINGVSAQTTANTHSITALQMNTESIAASVSKVEENITNTIDGINGDITTLTNKVDAAMTADAVKLSIQEELANGVDKVYTSTGFSFDANGLRVSKTGSEMESLLDEDGLTVYRDNVEVLTADNTGVNGINMTVRQYLIVGGSRFEDYGGRTGCFWIG